MSLDIYLKTDVQATLVALAVQAVGVYAAGGDNPDYIRGNLDAIRATAIAHKCAWPDMLDDIRANLAPELVTVLDAAAPMIERKTR